MVDLMIKKDMLEILSSMKGKTLKSIEGRYDFTNKTFMEIVRLNLGQYAIEFVSDYVAVQWFWNADDLFQDEATCFSVIKKSLSEKHDYPKGNDIIQLIENEIISEVVIVRDRIYNNKGDEIFVDSGIVIRTKENVFSFSRCDLGGFWIHLNQSDKIDMYYSEKDEKKECSDKNTGLLARVKREYIFL